MLFLPRCTVLVWVAGAVYHVLVHCIAGILSAEEVSQPPQYLPVQCSGHCRLIAQCGGDHLPPRLSLV